jgi:hypothetical protein
VLFSFHSAPAWFMLFNRHEEVIGLMPAAMEHFLEVEVGGCRDLAQTAGSLHRPISATSSQ